LREGQSEGGKEKNMTWVYIIIALIVLIALIYWVKSRGKAEAPTATPEEAPTTEESTGEGEDRPM